MRVLVCGGRNYNDAETLCRVLGEVTASLNEDITVIVGDATGADQMAWDWAVHRCRTIRYEADWKTHGRAAGPIRNQRMLDEGKPDLVVAFPGGRGTADMVRRARAAGVAVREVAG
jgi:hypothetical protein